MIARILSIYLHPTSYKVVGYLDHKAFIIEIDSTTKELLKFHSLSHFLHRNSQDFVYECAMQTIDNNLKHIQLIHSDSDTPSDDLLKLAETNENDVDANDLAAILLKTTSQNAVDQFRDHIFIN